MIATTLEQSRKLVEIGVNTNTADCTITFSEERGQFIADKYPAMRPYSDLYNEFKLRRFTDKYIQNLIHPAWSLSALLTIIPSEIPTGAEQHNQYQLSIRKHDKFTYQIAYGNDRGLGSSWHDMINTKECDTLLEAAFEMIVWLKENKFI